MAQWRRTRRAEEDLIDIWRFIAGDSPRAADMVLDMLDEKSRLLAENPGIGTARDDILPGIRYFPWRDYLIFYRQTDGGIEIVRYLHGARDYATLLKDRSGRE